MDATATTKKEENLSIKELQTHLIKTVLGALAVAMIGAFITSYISTYTTKNSIDELNKSKTETAQDIKSLKADVNDIKISLSNTGIYTNNNIDDIKALKDDVKEIKKGQEEMLKLLYQINLKK